MRVQAQVVENVQADSGLLAELVSQSQSASGSLQVSQATNQLIALSTKQQLPIQQMMAAQYRADAIEPARQQQAMEAAREATTRLLGAAHTYPTNCQPTAKHLHTNTHPTNQPQNSSASTRHTRMQNT